MICLHNLSLAYRLDYFIASLAWQVIKITSTNNKYIYGIMEDNINIESQIFGTIRILPHKFSFEAYTYCLFLTLKTLHGVGRRDFWTLK